MILNGRSSSNIMDTAPLYVDERIKFQGFGNSNYRSREIGEEQSPFAQQTLPFFELTA
jgi:hypothetical protein